MMAVTESGTPPSITALETSYFEMVASMIHKQSMVTTFNAPIDKESPRSETPSSIITSNHEESLKVATSFEQFPRLPLEIQRMIWNLTIPKPRILEVDFLFRYNGVWVNEFTYTFGSGIKMPQALSVCSESRSEALRTYKEIIVRDSTGEMCYLDHAHDTVYLTGHKCFDHHFWSINPKSIGSCLRPFINQEIRNLAVNIISWPKWMATYQQIAIYLPKLKTLTLIYDFRKIPAKYIADRYRFHHLYTSLAYDQAKLLREFNKATKKLASKWKPIVSFKSYKGHHDDDGDILFEDVVHEEIEIPKPMVVIGHQYGRIILRDQKNPYNHIQGVSFCRCAYSAPS